MDIFAIIGGIAGLIAIASVLWRGGKLSHKVDTLWGADLPKEINTIKTDIASIRAELKDKVDTLWDIYVLDPLKRRPDLVGSSEMHLNAKGRDLLGELGPKIEDLVKETHQSCTKAPLIVKYFGIDYLSAHASKSGLTLQELIALASLYLEEVETGSKPSLEG